MEKAARWPEMLAASDTVTTVLECLLLVECVAPAGFVGV
jgi:hypothetical protein